MKTKRKILAVAVGIIACSAVVWLSTSLQGGQKTYELEPRLTIPEYKTDVARIMDSYERLMERYMDLTDRNSALMITDIKSIAASLDSINASLAELSVRTARIEQALGVQQPVTPSGTLNRSQTITSDRQTRSENPR